MLTGKKALLLDMNGTFMFGEDRFSDSEDFSVHYNRIGGTLSRPEINKIVRDAYEFLCSRYPEEAYRHNFPSLETTIHQVVDIELSGREVEAIVATFAFHELGYIPQKYATALHKLREHFILAAVIDIWSPKTAWLELFEKAGIADLFSATSFSSDHGMVKPSPKPFLMVLNQLGLSNEEAVVIGDSVRRDLGGAKNAGIDCILVGGAEHPDAIKNFSNLLELGDSI